MSSLRSINQIVRSSLRIATVWRVNPVVCCYRNFSSILYRQVDSKVCRWRTKTVAVDQSSIITRNLSTVDKMKGPLDSVTYENVCGETLESLNDYMDELMTNHNKAEDADSTYGDGVLTVKLGNSRGTYVINKQTPNKQIWLSSPISGPKRYDFIDGRWIYKHDGVALHDLLTKEFNILLKTETNFSKCAYG